VSFDALRARHADLAEDPRVALRQLDVCDAGAVKDAIAGCDVVFHLASYGMSGGAMLDWVRCRAVNVGGTQNVVDACDAAGVKALVYTSSYNVVYGGQEIDGGDEDTPAHPLERHTDAYGPTKAMAEVIALGADTPCCSLRPAAIYGDDEDRHLPRIAALMRLGLYRFFIGGADVKVDWLHADNFVDAQVLAMAELLGGGKRSAARSRAFFISDGAPVNSFDFLQPLGDAVGAPAPALRMSTEFMLGVASVCEALAALGLPPFLTRAEVLRRMGLA